MNKQAKNKLVFFLLAVYLLASVLAMVGLDKAISEVANNLRAISLKDAADGGLYEISREIKSLDQSISNLEELLATGRRLTFPTLRDIRSVAEKEQIKITAVERINSGEQQTNFVKHRLTLSGNATRLIRFIRDWESNYLMMAENISMQPVSTDGKLVALVLIAKFKSS